MGLSFEMQIHEKEQKEYADTDNADCRCVGRIVDTGRGRVFLGGFLRRLFESDSIFAVILLDDVAMQSGIVLDITAHSGYVDFLGHLGIQHRSLDIDFQSIEAKVNITEKRVYLDECTVLLRVCD